MNNRRSRRFGCLLAIVGANVNAADSHYAPPETGSAPIRRGDLVLLDLWAKLRDEPKAVYYDITWMAFCGNEVSERMRQAVAVVVGARDAGIRLVQAAVAAGRNLRGFEVDDAVRGHIESCGMGPCVRHRTGHSIGREVHGVGANMDTSRRTTSGRSFLGPASPSSRHSTCPTSVFARRSISSSRNGARV